MLFNLNESKVCRNRWFLINTKRIIRKKQLTNNYYSTALVVFVIKRSKQNYNLIKQPFLFLSKLLL